MEKITNSLGKTDNHIESDEKLQQSIKYLDVEEVSLGLNLDNSDLDVAGNQLVPDNKSRQWYEPFAVQKNQPSDSTDNTNEVRKHLDSTKVVSPLKELYNLNISSPGVSSTKVDVNPDDNVNSFRFNFERKYDPAVEQILYPKFYQKFKINGDYVMQRTGSYRTVCLTCQCELLMQKNTQIIMSHVSGQKHMRRSSNPLCVISVTNYHDIFYNLDPNFQANQVYFTPDDVPGLVKCVLCLLYVRQHQVQAHILSEPHKSKVIRARNDPNFKCSFFMLDSHLEVYGIKPEIDTATEGQQGLDQDQVQKNRKDHRRVIMSGTRKDVNVKPHEIVKSVENPNDPDPLKTVPRRFNDHLKFLKTKGSSITCTACTNGRQHFQRKDMQLHLMQNSHLQATQLSLLNCTYFCEICDKQYHDEMTWYFHLQKTSNKHENMAPSRKDKVCEYECLTCNIIIYGDNLSLRRHQNSLIRKIEKKRAIVLSPEVKKYFCSKTFINEQVQKLWEDSQKVLLVQTDMVMCCNDMESALSGYFVHCRAYPFGSRISGLGSSDSDLDVFIDIGGMYDGLQKQDEENQIEIIRIAYEMFRKKKEFYKITSRPTARTPIIKLKHRSTSLDCDISFRHGLSVENTKFLRFCFELQPVSQKLILLLKKWSHLCLLNENITTYAFAMMTIFYLQTKNYLISVQLLKELNPQKSTVIDGWETVTYSTPIEKIREKVEIFDGDILKLLKGFFKYYCDFNYKTDVVCPLLGKILLKSQFTDDIRGGKLPPEMATYVYKVNHDDPPEYFRSLSEFCVQDPFDLSHNLTKACTKVIVEKFKTLCSLTYDMLNKLED